MKRVLLIMALVLCECGVTHASAISDVIAYIDWATLNIDGATVEWGSRYEASYTNAKNNLNATNPQVDKSEFNSLTGVSTTNSVTNATGYGYSAPSPNNWVAAEAHSIADGIATTYAEASASVHRRDWFKVTENATITLSLDYSFWHSIQAGDPSESGSAYSVASLILLGPQNDFDNPIDYKESDFWHNFGGSFSTKGTLSVSGNLLAGELYSIEAHVYGADSANAPLRQSPVPEPATIALFGIGIAVMAFTARKKKPY